MGLILLAFSILCCILIILFFKKQRNRQSSKNKQNNKKKEFDGVYILVDEFYKCESTDKKNKFWIAWTPYDILKANI